MKFSILFKKLSEIAHANESVELIRIRPMSDNAQNAIPEIQEEIKEILGSKYTAFFTRPQKERGQS